MDTTRPWQQTFISQSVSSCTVTVA